MTRLLVWRHGQTAWNVEGRVQGQTDVDLDERGAAQAAATARRLASYRPDLIVSSDLTRARRTAQALSVLVGAAVELDQRLRERHFGQWQGLTQPEIRERHPDDYRRWATSTAPVADAGVETVEDMTKRVGEAFRDVAERVGSGTAVIVTHGGAARIGCAVLLGWPPSVWQSLGGLGNCRFSELTFSTTRGWQLHAHNVA